MTEAPDFLDISRPNVARVYDYWLGGKNNFQADRDLAAKIAEVNSAAPRVARDNRRFVTHAVRWAALDGITQFIDVGSGLPTSPAVHETAQAVHPEARVAYVDNDPVVLAHAKALLRGPGLTAVAADLRDPAALLADPGLRELIDLEQPVCVILAAVLHFLPADQARQVTIDLAGPLAPDSRVVVSTGYSDPEVFDRDAAAYTAARWFSHDRETIASFFAGAGLELTDPPGVTIARSWQAGKPESEQRPAASEMLVAAGRKP
jgi:O-methyltransferase involved in polyketide biosynthesis